MSRLPVLHLGRRFVGALWPGGPGEADEAWVATLLGPAGRCHELWRTMSGPDRRHAVGVARRAAGSPLAADPEVLVAALLHDVGKVDAGLGTWARVPVTLAGAATPRARSAGWQRRRRGLRRRAGRYLHHDEIGAAMLRDAGAPTLAWRWAAEHHRPQQCWTVPAAVAALLKAADDD